MEEVKPEVYLVGKTELPLAGLHKYLHDIGDPDV